MIQIFAKNPQTAQVKTRLQPLLNRVGAQQFYHRLCLQTLKTATATAYDCQLWIAGSKHSPFFQQCQQQYAVKLQQQHGKNLGIRMQKALQQGLKHYQKVILIGTDCPSLTVEYLQIAVRTLDQTPTVLAPAYDGGYVLIGMKNQCQPLFFDMPWSQKQLYQKTKRRLHRLKQACHNLSPMHDIDNPLDYLAITKKLEFF